jgi:hypothetical protein
LNAHGILVDIMGVYKNKNPITSCLMFHKNLYASIAWIFIKHNKHLKHTYKGIACT